jgi:hypothetical protein
VVALEDHSVVALPQLLRTIDVEIVVYLLHALHLPIFDLKFKLSPIPIANIKAILTPTLSDKGKGRTGLDGVGTPWQLYIINA